MEVLLCIKENHFTETKLLTGKKIPIKHFIFSNVPLTWDLN